jgi:chromosome segregation protein
MRLTKLDIHGFKSFADRTEFAFEGGLTGVVGPNGCGKSNVLDSVKWILGEQRPTSLRGQEMTDVIFNGTDRRSPMGMAEGSLHFDNVDRVLPIEEDTVVVTRRLFRSGEGEYLINKKPVRLKDVRNLFLGTGLVPGGYAFMEQGKIDSILASNAVDRRRIFEEAAGISRFRVRQREVELKLAKVGENLLRLVDIIEEVDRQLRSLKVHAGKARSYLEVQGRLKELQTKANLHRFHLALLETSEVDNRILIATGERDLCILDRDRLRTSHAEVEEEMRVANESLATVRANVAELAAQVEAARQRVTFHRQHEDELTSRIERKKGEVEAKTSESARLRQDLVVATRERHDLAHDQERLRADLVARESDLEAARAEEAALEAALAEGVALQQACLREISDLANEETRLSTTVSHLEEEIARLDSARTRREEERARFEAECREKRGQEGDHAQALADGRERLQAAEQDAEASEKTAGARADEVRRLEGELARVESRAEVLDAAIHKREGLDEGPRAILAKKKEDQAFLPGFRGLLSDLFEVDLSEARAVEAALGDAASALVVETVAEALAGIEFLRGGLHGGATFVPLECFDAVLVRDLNGIRPSDPTIARVLSALIGGIRIVKADALVAELARGPSPLLVSAEGAVVREGRVFVHPRGRGKPGAVMHQAELKLLRSRGQVIRAELDSARTRLQQALDETERWRATMKDASVALLRQEGDAVRLEQELQRIEGEIARLGGLDREDEARRGLAASGRAEAMRDLAALEVARRDVEDRSVRIENDLRARREEVAEKGATLRRLSEAVQSARVEQARAQERLDSKVLIEQHLTDAIRAAEEALGSAVREIGEDQERRETARQAAADESAAAQALETKQHSAKDSALAEESRVQAIRGRMDSVAGELRVLETNLDAANERLATERGRHTELKTVMTGLVERSREELSVDLSQLYETWSDDPAEDWDQVTSQVQELKDRLTRLGNVNLAAIDELAAVEQRSEFLHREKEDLDRSQASLTEVLKSIEKQSSSLFLETFNTVREHFVVIFRKLFNGGKAEILLEDETKPLECGIEIKARPPGKELRSITLLSGGERTMTAVALLFAILRSNPAPCALLDEVDAALDEDNTERFGRMLDEFIGKTQFIIVTHSKRTMDKADLLVGVTMPERGVSRRVAVKLTQIAADGTIKDVDALNRAAIKEARERAQAAEEDGGDEGPAPSAPPAAAASNGHPAAPEAPQAAAEPDPAPARTEEGAAVS